MAGGVVCGHGGHDGLSEYHDFYHASFGLVVSDGVGISLAVRRSHPESGLFSWLAAVSRLVDLWTDAARPKVFLSGIRYSDCAAGSKCHRVPCGDEPDAFWMLTYVGQDERLQPIPIPSRDPSDLSRGNELFYVAVGAWVGFSRQAKRVSCENWASSLWLLPFWSAYFPLFFIRGTTFGRRSRASALCLP